MYLKKFQAGNQYQGVRKFLPNLGIYTDQIQPDLYQDMRIGQGNMPIQQQGTYLPNLGMNTNQIQPDLWRDMKPPMDRENQQVLNNIPTYTPPKRKIDPIKFGQIDPLLLPFATSMFSILGSRKEQRRQDAWAQQQMAGDFNSTYARAANDYGSEYQKGGKFSVVDYMISKGMNSSKESRKKLAKDLGIKDYNFSAENNIELLRLLKTQTNKKPLLTRNPNIFAAPSSQIPNSRSLVEQNINTNSIVKPRLQPILPKRDTKKEQPVNEDLLDKQLDLIKNNKVKNDTLPFAVVNKQSNKIIYYDKNNKEVKREDVITGTDQKDIDTAPSMREWMKKNDGKVADDYFKYLNNTQQKITPAGAFTLKKRNPEKVLQDPSTLGRLINSLPWRKEREDEIAMHRKESYGPSGQMFNMIDSEGKGSSKAVHGTGYKDRIEAFSDNKLSKSMSNGCVNLNGKTICFDFLKNNSKMYVMPSNGTTLNKFQEGGSIEEDEMDDFDFLFDDESEQAPVEQTTQVEQLVGPTEEDNSEEDMNQLAMDVVNEDSQERIRMALQRPAQDDYSTQTVSGDAVGAKEQQVMSYLQTQHGLPKHAAAAITSNMKAESGFNPTASGDKGTSYGAFQWRDPTPGKGRKTNMLNWMKQNGKNPNDIYAQIDFAMFEGSQRGDLQKTVQSQDASSAAFSWAKNFERPKRVEAKRMTYANKLMQYASGGEYEVDEETINKLKEQGYKFDLL